MFFIGRQRYRLRYIGMVSNELSTPLKCFADISLDSIAVSRSYRLLFFSRYPYSLVQTQEQLTQVRTTLDKATTRQSRKQKPLRWNDSHTGYKSFYIVSKELLKIHAIVKEICSIVLPSGFYSMKWVSRDLTSPMNDWSEGMGMTEMLSLDPSKHQLQNKEQELDLIFSLFHSVMIRSHWMVI